MGYIIDEAYKNSSVLLDNLWDFNFIPKKGNKGRIESLLKFKVIDINLPTRKFTVETHNTGEKYYTGFTPEEEFAITFREDGMLNVLSFFKEWEDSFYDPIEKTFISMPKGTQKGSEEDAIHKDGVLSISKFVKKFNTFYPIWEKLVFPLPIRYTPQVIDRIKNVGELITGKFSNPIPPPHVKKPATLVRSRYIELEETVKFTFKNMKYLGIDPLDFSYETGEPITYSASFACDYISAELVPTPAKMDQNVVGGSVSGLFSTDEGL